MILSFKHKGLANLLFHRQYSWNYGGTSKKLRLILGRLNAANSIDDMKTSGIKAASARR